MDSEAIEFTCPCCSSTLGLDDAGDLYLVKDNLPGRKGVNGIRTSTVGGNDWTQKKYIQSEPKRYTPPIERMMGLAGKQEEPIHAPEILEANKNDLKQRNIH